MLTQSRPSYVQAAASCAGLLFLATPASAQAVAGGESAHLLHLTDNVPGTLFGGSVSNAGDVDADGYDDLLVGATGMQPIGTHVLGTARVFSGSTGALLYTWYGGAIDDFFGDHVSAAGDTNADGYADILVSARNAGGASGSVYVYSGFDGSLLHQWDGATPGTSLGFSISGAGDSNADGYDDVLIGAPGYDITGKSNVGAVYLYSGATGAQLRMWKGTQSNGGFGNAVSGAGDVNGDGKADVIIGAPRENAASYAEGVAYVYNGWSGMLLRKYEGAQPYDEFGFSVSGAGDVNGDGRADVAIGSRQAAVGTLYYAGSVFVRSGVNGALLHQYDGTTQNGSFGYSISNAGDTNGDGVEDLIIGAYSEDPAGLSNAGSAYLYSGNSGALLAKWDGSYTEDNFGATVSGAGDTNGDGLADVIVGAAGEDLGPNDYAGGAHVYSFKPFLQPDASTMSLSAGGVLHFALDFPTSSGLDDYKILLSAAGTGPTTYGVQVPLTIDSMVLDSYFGIYPVPTFSNMHGTLDISGVASASMTLPANLSPSLAGAQIHFAAIASMSGLLPQFSSAPVTITLAL